MKQGIIKYTLSVLLCAGMINAHAAAPASLSNDSVFSLARRMLGAASDPLWVACL